VTGAGVLRAVAAAARAVVVRCVRIETGAAVVGVAFARLYGTALFGFPLFPLLLFLPFCLFPFSKLSGFGTSVFTGRFAAGSPPRGLAALPRFRPARFAGAPLACRFSRRCLSGFLLSFGFRIGAAANSGQRDSTNGKTR
jgi:hypothetical protein